MEGAWERLAPALRRLDARLAQAVEIAQQRFGEEATNDPYRGLRITPDHVARALAIAPGTPLPFREAPPDAASIPGEATPLALLRDVLGLEDFDLDVLVIALAPELDLRYERLYAYLQDDVTRRRPTVDLALNLLCHSAAEKIERRQRFLPEAPLLRHGLIHLVTDPAQTAPPPLLAHYLRLDGQILRRLLGQVASTRCFRRFASWSRRVPARPWRLAIPLRQLGLQRSRRRRERRGGH